MTYTQAILIASEHCAWAEANGYKPYHYLQAMGMKVHTSTVTWLRTCKTIAHAVQNMAGAA